MPHKLLLADDSVTIQRVIELTFADEDVEVKAVSTGQQAIDAVTADPPDIVLADVGMPERDGYEVAAYIKGRASLAHIPVLLLTGAFEPVDEARAAEARCDGVLAKPFEPQMLITRVKELLPAAGRRGGPAEAPPADEPPVTAGFDRVPPAPEGGEESALDVRVLLDAQPGRSAEADVSLDDYFDRLDQAFASLVGTAGKTGLPLPESWSATTVEVRDEQVSAPIPAAPPAYAAAPGSRAVAVADVFSSILEAEAAGQAAATPLAVPVPPPAVSDDLVERVVRLVVDRMAEREVRQAVADTVSRVAERLVREEIERLKALPR